MDTLKDNSIVRFITEITLSLASCLPLSKQVEISCMNTAVTSYLSQYGQNNFNHNFRFHFGFELKKNPNNKINKMLLVFDVWNYYFKFINVLNRKEI